MVASRTKVAGSIARCNNYLVFPFSKSQQMPLVVLLMLHLLLSLLVCSYICKVFTGNAYESYFRKSVLQSLDSDKHSCDIPRKQQTHPLLNTPPPVEYQPTNRGTHN